MRTDESEASTGGVAERHVERRPTEAQRRSEGAFRKRKEVKESRRRRAPLMSDGRYAMREDSKRDCSEDGLRPRADRDQVCPET